MTIIPTAPMMGLAGTTAIVGMGQTDFFGNAERPPLAMASQVVSDALEDAGLSRSDVDGLVVHIGSPRGSDYDRTAKALNLRTRFSAQPWSHGRFAATAIMHAAMALTVGLADCIVVVAAYNNSAFGRHGTKERSGYHESLREGGGPHAETPYTGLTAPAAGAAMALQRYMHKYGVDPAKLAAISVTQRRHAQLNPRAAMRKPVFEQDYQTSRFIVEPLRLYDCSFVVDGAVALILTRSDRARDCKSSPIYLCGAQGVHGGPDEFIFGQPGLGIDQSDVFDYQPPGANQLVYQMAGVTPGDIDGLHIYDAFSPQVLWGLERFGFCKQGEAVDFIQNGRIGLGGTIPVNTSGGHLSEGHFNGWGHISEMITQLRGKAGERQIPNAKLMQWATTLGDSLILGTSPHGHAT